MGPGLWSRLPMCPSFPPEEPCPPRPVSWQIVQGFLSSLGYGARFLLQQKKNSIYVCTLRAWMYSNSNRCFLICSVESDSQSLIITKRKPGLKAFSSLETSICSQAGGWIKVNLLHFIRKTNDSLGFITSVHTWSQVVAATFRDQELVREPMRVWDCSPEPLACGLDTVASNKDRVASTRPAGRTRAGQHDGPQEGSREGLGKWFFQGAEGLETGWESVTTD